MKIYPHSAERAHCKLCHAAIAWVLTFPKRNRCPIDRPYQFHNLKHDADGHEIAELISTTHFETCPQYDRTTGKAKPKPKPISQPGLF